MSQIPQLSGSFWRSVHWSPQQTSPSSQHSSMQHARALGQHVAPQQTLPAGQHTDPQHSWLLGQQSAPPQQLSPDAHLPPVPPQVGPWHCPVCASQVSSCGQVPQEPPHPSGPHCLPWQSGVHWHRPPWQTSCAPEQVAQATPLLPQDCSVLPPWHWLFLQQPFGHVCGPQTGAPSHCPLWVLQVCPVRQDPHVPEPPQPSGPHCRPEQFGAQHSPAGLHWLASP